MNRINNIIKPNNTKFKGLQNMNDNIKSIDEMIEETIKTLFTRAEREVPEYGDFSPVYEQFKNTDKTQCATDFMIKIAKPPKNIENHERIRNLELVAYKLPQPYKAERIIATGDKDEILKALKNKDLAQELKSALSSLSDSLEDI